MADKTYASGVPGSDITGPTADKDEAERKRAAYDASVVAEATASAKKRSGVMTASPSFRINAPNMPRRAVPARQEMNPKPPSTPY